MKTKVSKKIGTGTKLMAAGAGLAAVAAAAAGVYFLYGDKAKARRKVVAAWVLQMKGDVMEKMETMKEVNRETYEALVDETAARYARVKNVGADEMKHVTGELKNAWTHISSQLK